MVCRSQVANGNKNNINDCPHSQATEAEQLSYSFLPVAEVESGGVKQLCLMNKALIMFTATRMCCYEVKEGNNA